MIAGPTDVTIIADKNISKLGLLPMFYHQLEHGADSKAFVIVNDEKFAVKILAK